MDRLREFRLGIALAALCGASALGAEQHTVAVFGEGRVSAVPDKALVSLGVTTQAPRAEEAARRNRESMQKIFVALADLGIAERSMATSNYSIHYERPRPNADADNGVYRVSNMLRVELAVSDRIDAVLDAAVLAGVNQVWGVEMMLSDVEALSAAARAKAAAHARAKAEDLARLHGRELGAVLRIAEEGASHPQPRKLALEAGGGVIRPGEQAAMVRLEVVYALR